MMDVNIFDVVTLMNLAAVTTLAGSHWGAARRSAKAEQPSVTPPPAPALKLPDPLFITEPYKKVNETPADVNRILQESAKARDNAERDCREISENIAGSLKRLERRMAFQRLFVEVHKLLADISKFRSQIGGDAFAELCQSLDREKERGKDAGDELALKLDGLVMAERELVEMIGKLNDGSLSIESLDVERLYLIFDRVKAFFDVIRRHYSSSLVGVRVDKSGSAGSCAEPGHVVFPQPTKEEPRWDREARIAAAMLAVSEELRNLNMKAGER